MFTAEQRQRIAAETTGKTIASLEWEPDGGYWVMTFTDGTETSIRFMAEMTP
jgi:hypothetical protein